MLRRPLSTSKADGERPLARNKTMPYVIIAHGPVSNPGLIEAEYLQHYNPSANHGRGDATFTNDQDKAMQFASVFDALQMIMQAPPERPLRADGQPNRPIRAFSLEIQKLPA